MQLILMMLACRGGSGANAVQLMLVMLAGLSWGEGGGGSEKNTVQLRLMMLACWGWFQVP